jgi:hypothetical protein
MCNTTVSLHSRHTAMIPVGFTRISDGSGGGTYEIRSLLLALAEAPDGVTALTTIV